LFSNLFLKHNFDFDQKLFFTHYSYAAGVYGTGCRVSVCLSVRNGCRLIVAKS